MAVTSSNTQILGGYGGGTATYTATAGSDRMVIIIIAHYRTSGTPVLDNCTMGAQQATKLYTEAHVGATGSKRISHTVFYIKEADIPSGSQTIAYDKDSVSQDLSAGGNRNVVMVTTLAGVDQVATPYHEDPVNINSTIATAPKNILASFGANAGKYGLSTCFVRGGAYDFVTDNGTIVADKGTSIASYITDAGSDRIHVGAREIASLASSEVLTWTVDYDNSATNSGGHPLLVSHALVFDAVGANPTVTIDQSTIIPGGTISGTYSNFTPGTAPTTPLTLTDGTNTINITVSVNDSAGDGTGTFTGTVPALPAAGNSGSYVLFGSVTATLDDA